MINNSKVLAIVPARSGSKGLPNKNIKEFCGKPLLAWPIQAARSSAYIDCVAVSTDSQKYADIASNYLAEVPYLRPEELAKDTATSFDVIDHCLKWYKENKNMIFKYVVLLEPTSPLTEAEDIDKAIEFLEKSSVAKSLVTVVKAESFHPDFCVTLGSNALIKPHNGFANNVRRQDLKDIFFLDGSLYVSEVESLLKYKGFYHEETLGLQLEDYKSIEIDSLKDFICAEAIMKNKEKFL